MTTTSTTPITTTAPPPSTTPPVFLPIDYESDPFPSFPASSSSSSSSSSSASSPALTKLVVVGGFDGSQWHRDIRVLDLKQMNGGGSSGECARLPDIPLRGLNSGGVSALVGGRAIMCGGATLACFFLERDEVEGKWMWRRTEFNMPGIRIFPTALVTKNSSEWWVTGGRGVGTSNRLTTMTLTMSDEEVDGTSGFRLSPVRLPVPLRGHSLLQLNDTHFFLHGGFAPNSGEDLARAWILDSTTGEWEEQPPSAVGRRKAFSGVVNINGEEVRNTLGAPSPVTAFFAGGPNAFLLLATPTL